MQTTQNHNRKSNDTNELRRNKYEIKIIFISLQVLGTGFEVQHVNS